MNPLSGSIDYMLSKTVQTIKIGVSASVYLYFSSTLGLTPHPLPQLEHFIQKFLHLYLMGGSVICWLLALNTVFNIKVEDRVGLGLGVLLESVCDRGGWKKPEYILYRVDY